MTWEAFGSRDGRAGRPLHIALHAALAAVCLVYLLRPITEADFFWHLKTGAWIVEHRRLPATDPFSYTGSAVDTTASRFTLTSSWASQVLFSVAYTLGGFSGVVVLRFLLAAALFTVTWKRLQGEDVVSAALLVVFAVALLDTFTLDRPQAFSFLCFGVLLWLLDGLKAGVESPRARPPSLRGRRGPLLVSLLMLVWANVHGGFVLGQAAIVVYLVMEGAKFAHASLRPVGGENYRALVLAGGAGLTASLANPNTYHALEMLLPKEGAEGQRTLIAEYLSTVEMVQRFREYSVVIVWALMLLAFLAIVAKPKEVDITEAFLVAGSAYFAFKHTRYAPFFMTVALPVLGRFLSRWGGLEWWRLGVTSVALALALGFAWDERKNLWRLRTGEWVDRAVFPIEAADFILATGLDGTMYNYYNWGGYLIWRLAPERKVFVDGRNINPGIHWQALVVRLGLEQGRYAWRSLLDRYGVTYVLIPVTEGGKQVPLFERLSRAPDWVLRFNTSNSAIFQRRLQLRQGERRPGLEPAK